MTLPNMAILYHFWYVS